MEQDLSEKKYTFSKPNVERYFVNYFDKFILICVLVTIILSFIRDDISIYGGIITAIILLILALIFVLFHQRFAYQLLFDLDSRMVTFRMFRNKGDILASLDDIKEVHVNYFITFVLDEMQVKYNDVNNKQILDFLDASLKVNRGFWARLLRPKIPREL